MTSCLKCRQGAQVAMSFNYSNQEMWIGDIGPGYDRHSMYALCEMHADRLVPPVGWSLYDNRRTSEPPLFLSVESSPNATAPQLLVNGVA